MGGHFLLAPVLKVLPKGLREAPGAALPPGPPSKPSSASGTRSHAMYH